MKRIFFLSIMFVFSMILWPQTAGHEHDQEREAMMQALFAISWPHTYGLQSATILTATTPVALLLWADGAAITIDAKEFVDAGLDLTKRPGSNIFFDNQYQQIVITPSDVRTITQEFRYKEAIFADFLILHADMVVYNQTEGSVTIDLGEASASWPVTLSHDDTHDHQHDDEKSEEHHHEGDEDFLLGRKFWPSRQPLKPNQRERLGQPQSQLRFQVIINAKPLIKAGLDPKQLRTMRYEREAYGWFNLFKRERIIAEFYF